MRPMKYINYRNNMNRQYIADLVDVLTKPTANITNEISYNDLLCYVRICVNSQCNGCHMTNKLQVE